MTTVSQFTGLTTFAQDTVLIDSNNFLPFWKLKNVHPSPIASPNTTLPTEVSRALKIPNKYVS